MNLEVLIPVRNPTEVFFKTIDSIAAQTDRNFTVLISDNFSKTGQEYVENALAKLDGAGIAGRRIQPPAELGRVEHWNWLHYQSGAGWYKPLFAGDWLEPDYFAALHGIISGEPRCGYVYSGHVLHRGGGIQTVLSHWRGRFFTPEEMQDVVIRFAMQFGPPSAAAYRRDIFFNSGGYDPRLPICADSLLFCQLAARNGAYGLPKAYTHFLIHAARFSHQLPEKERETFREVLRYYAELGICAWQERWRFPKFGYLRLFAREIRRHLRAR